MQARVVSIAQGLAWLGSGWSLFMRAPGQWIAITIVYFVLAMVISLIPLIGAAAFTIATPALYAGLLIIARDLNTDGSFELGKLFYGLSDEKLRNPLLTLGGILFAAQVLIVLALIAMGAVGALGIAGLASGSSSSVPIGVSIVVSMLIALTLAALLTMALVYASPLVAFVDVAPVDALKSSLHACIINVWPMTVVGLILMVLAILAAIPFLLGMLVLMPVTICAIYASFEDLYPSADQAQITHQS